MVSVIKLAIVISATNRASKAFTQAEAGTNKVVAAIKAMRSHMAALAAVEIIAFTRAMVDAFSQFELQMVRTATIIDEVGISTGELERQVRFLGRTTIFSGCGAQWFGAQDPKPCWDRRHCWASRSDLPTAGAGKGNQPCAQ